MQESQKRLIKSHLQCRHINKEIPVIAGAESQIGSHRNIFLCGKEGVGIFSKEQIISEDFDTFPEKKKMAIDVLEMFK